jgi:hypothetical protein
MVKSKDAAKGAAKPERREPGPKNKRSVIPESFQISRQPLPMRRILDEAEGRTPPPAYEAQDTPHTTNPIAPERDFGRVANSITRDALPARLFHGQSKKLYDALYHRTRAAIQPQRLIRATHDNLMDWAGVSHNTLKKHIKHLCKVGLLKVHYERGDNTGAEYEIFLPEEVGSPTHHPPPTTHQKLGPPTTQKVVGGGWWFAPIESTTYESPKTSIKTIEIDDDDSAFADLLALLKKAAKEITGKTSHAGERERWRELGELLIAELRIASARTTVSSVPAFLTEHLRRRLWKKEKGQLAEPNALAEASTTNAFTREQIQTCPDCGGTCFYYPNGFEGGVARCTHAHLMPQPES